MNAAMEANADRVDEALLSYAYAYLRKAHKDRIPGARLCPVTLCHLSAHHLAAASQQVESMSITRMRLLLPGVIELLQRFLQVRSAGHRTSCSCFVCRMLVFRKPLTALRCAWRRCTLPGLW